MKLIDYARQQGISYGNAWRWYKAGKIQDQQVERLVVYCAVRGYQASKVVKEIGSGFSNIRPKFLALLADPSIGRIVIEYQDQGTCFGFRYIETLLNTYVRTLKS